jgi:hypothetical protein
MSILGDVAPYSREYQKYAGVVRHHSQYDSDLRAEYERIQEQVRQTKESTIQVAQRHFNAPVDTIEGTSRAHPPRASNWPSIRAGPSTSARWAARWRT